MPPASNHAAGDAVGVEEDFQGERKQIQRRLSLPVYAIVVALIVLACILAVIFVGTSAPRLHYDPGGSSLGS